MTHFLRNSKNKTIIECDVTKVDLHSATNIQNYSEMLLSLEYTNPKRQFIEDMSDLDEIRGWWWERQEQDDYESIDKFVEEKFRNFAKKWIFLDLSYVTD